ARTASNKYGYPTIQKLLEEKDDYFVPVDLHPKEDVAVIQYTGGTTGVSKGAMLTHYNLFANVVQTHEFLGVHSREGEEKILNVLPLFHVYGMTVSMNYSIYLKSTMYLMERFTSQAVLEIIHQERITMFPGTPTIYVAVNHDTHLKNYDLSSVHTCISGSAPLPIEVKNKFELLTGAAIVDAYGLSEASPLTHSNPVNGKRVPGSMGLPVTNTDCKIVDIDKGETELPVNTPGELIIKGPQVMKGYWNRPDETANTLRDGWLYTGDVAYINEEGYCFIVSRKKEVIIAGGYNIYPRDVEEVIFMHSAVKEVVVVGVPDEYHGEIVKAYIMLNEEHVNITEEDIIQFCRGRLARYKVPRAIEFTDEIPKSAVGKILRRKLLERELDKLYVKR
ncbi:MAG TPA: AMP-binding protein, partial [Chondromyces sp.]|nr:AMP-binding protein [Chondromyces sp.]